MQGANASDRQRAGRILAVATGLLALMPAAPAAAQLPSGMTSTWSAFQSAVRTNDPEAMARISHFPLQSNEFGGPISDPTELRRRFALIFSAGRRACLLQQTPAPLPVNGLMLYEAFCDADRLPIRFLFEPVSSGYRWTAIDNVNE